MRKLLMGGALLGCLALANCSDTADSFAVNDAAHRVGHIKVNFVRTGVGRGPVSVTMPDGELLSGTYRVASSGGYAMAFSGHHSASALVIGDGTVQFVMTGPKTEMLCRGDTSAFGHGSGQCQTYEGAVWAISW